MKSRSKIVLLLIICVIFQFYLARRSHCIRNIGVHPGKAVTRASLLHRPWRGFSRTSENSMTGKPIAAIDRLHKPSLNTAKRGPPGLRRVDSMRDLSNKIATQRHERTRPSRTPVRGPGIRRPARGSARTRLCGGTRPPNPATETDEPNHGSCQAE